jgi:hypothetical protein
MPPTPSSLLCRTKAMLCCYAMLCCTCTSLQQLRTCGSCLRLRFVVEHDWLAAPAFRLSLPGVAKPVLFDCDVGRGSHRLCKKSSETENFQERPDILRLVSFAQLESFPYLNNCPFWGFQRG